MSKLRPVHAMAVAVTALVFAATGISVAADSDSSSGPDRASGGPSAHASASKRGPRGKTGPRGPAGPRGSTGPAGPTGLTGATGSPGIVALKTVNSAEVTLPVNADTYTVAGTGFRANCPAGFAVVGTGFNSTVGHVGLVSAYGTFVGGFIYNDTNITIKVSVQAICAQVPAGTSVSRSLSGKPSAIDRFREDAAAAQAAIR